MSNLCYDICKWLDALVFFEQDDKLQDPSPGFSLYWLTGNVNESSQFSQKGGNAAPDVVVWPCFQKLFYLRCVILELGRLLLVDLQMISVRLSFLY